MKPRASALALLTVLLAGCGTEEAAPDVRPAQRPSPSAVADASPGSGPAAPLVQQPFPAAAREVRGRVRKLSAFQDQLRQNINPKTQGWDTEVLAEQLESGLATALRAWWERGERAALERWLPSTTVPFAQPWSVPKDSGRTVESIWTVHEPDLQESAAEPALLDQAGFLAMLSRWKEAFGPAALESLIVEAYRCDELGTEKFGVDLYIRTHARQGGEGWQHNLRLRAELPRQAPQAITSLHVLGNQWIHASATAFEERTGEVFGELACFRQEIARGNGDYHLRQDRLSNQPFLGMHGIAIGDPNGDGREDVYLAQPGGQANRLLLRRADGGLQDASGDWGVALLDNTGPAFFADLDGDGDQDLAMAIVGNILVRWNDERRTLERGVVLRAPDEAEITSMSAADFDNDGDLDIFACRYVRGGVAGGAPVPYHNANNGARNLYWRNDGANGFREAASDVGLDVHAERYTLALYIEDFNLDGWMDLYAVNDFGRNCLYLNEQGRFRDAAPEAGVVDQAAGMGADMDDVDGDGRLDLYVTNMHSPAGLRVAAQPRFLSGNPELRPDYLYHARGNTLLVAQPDGTYADRTVAAGVSEAGWAWGARFVDFGNDMRPDIFVPNGFASNPRQDDLDSFFWREVIARTNLSGDPAPEYAAAWDAIRHFTMFEGWSWNGWERKYAYLNLGDGRFADVSAVSRLDFLDDMRGAATLDWDDDGRMDLLLRNRSGPRLRLMINEQRTANHFLSLELSSDTGNREAIGAQVFVHVGNRVLRRSVQIAQGFMCASSRRVHFPLGPHASADLVRVRWPDGTQTRMEHVAADRHYRLRKGGVLEPREPLSSAQLRARPADPSPPMSMAPASRIVLIDKLPLGPIALPRLEGAPRRIAELAGSAVILSFGSGSDERSLRTFEAIEGQSADLRKYGVRHIVLLLDEPSQQNAARAALSKSAAGASLLAEAGFCTQRLRQLLEVMLIEVLGPFESLPQPLHLVLDKGGNLVAIHAAPDQAAEIVRDAATASYLAPEDRGTEALLGGGWARQPARDLKQVAEVLRQLGITELAQYYLKEESRRSAGR